MSSTSWFRRDIILEGMDQVSFTSKFQGDSKNHTLSLAWTDCNFGGKRPWFLCPNCGDRVEKLYSPHGEMKYLCRNCWDLTYKRCNISGDQKAIIGHKLENIREHLREKSKEEDYETGFYLRKPKDMHYETHLEIWKEYKELMKAYMIKYEERMQKREDLMEKMLS